MFNLSSFKSSAVYSVEVTCAGKEVVNGTYYPTEETRSGAPVYSKTGVFKGSDDDAIFIWRLSNGHWWISNLRQDGKLHQNVPNYYGSNGQKKSNAPPQNGWGLCRFGSKPIPTINIIRQSSGRKLGASKRWTSILFSKNASDIRLRCSDGELVYAHKVVLSTSCSYFSQLFESSWKDEHPDGVLETSYSGKQIKFVLIYIYTGTINNFEISKQPIEILSIAHDFNLKPIVQEVETYMSNNVQLGNVKDFLRSAIKYDLKDLKKSCVLFVKKNTFAVFERYTLSEISMDDSATN